jgi:predicted ferric reductase
MQRLVFVAWVAANVALFVHAFVRGALAMPRMDPAMEFGRGCALCLDFNGMLILLPMMRRTLTWVRAGMLGRVIPTDSAIDFHRWVGQTLFAFAIAHASAFVLAYANGHAGLALWRLVATSRGLTGALLLAVFAVMWLFSLAVVRRTRRFELFYFTHLLYVVWFVLAIVHAPPFALWAGVPILGFVVEQVLRLVRRGPRTSITQSQALRSGVTKLEVERPKGFDFGAGDYAFLRIPEVARHEWHPFTISSAPEKGTLTFHVRSLGNWTSALRRRVETESDAPLHAYVDGPYGSPSEGIFRREVVVLIGAGIGVTPYASVLESLVLRSNGKSSLESKLKKAYFFWLNRDQYAFEWFAALLRELEASDVKGLLDIHLCMTAARAGATAFGLELARSAMHMVGRSDLITGLRTHTHAGPPDWPRMLGEIAKRHAPQRVHVYFCGPPALGEKLRPECERLAMPFHEERF